MRFLNFFIDKTKLVNMLTIALLLVGILTVFSIKREARPRVDFDTVFVITLYPGAAMEDVELDVLLEVELDVLELVELLVLELVELVLEDVELEVLEVVVDDWKVIEGSVQK